MASAGTAYVSIRGDFGPLNTGLRQSQGAFGRSLRDVETRSQRTFRRIGAFAKVGAVAGIAGVGIAARKAFSEFEEAERATRQTEAVLKSTGGVANVTADEVERLANALSLKSGKDDEAIQSAQNLLLTFTSVRNEVGKGNDIFNQATSVIADMSAALGQDFKASTIQVGKALQDPIKGITALRRVGVNFNQQQTDMVKAMVESGDLLGAQKFILRELRTEFEGSAEAQATASDKMRVAINNLLEAFGKTFGPALSDAFQGLATFITQMQTGEGAGGKFADVIRGIGTVIKDTFGGIGDVFGSIFGGDTSGLDSAEGKVSGLKRALEDIQRVMAPVFAGLGQIGRGIAEAFRGVDQDLAAIGRGLLAISHAVASVLGPIVQRMIPGIVTAFRGLAQVIRGLVQVIAGILTLDFRRAWDGVENIFGGSLKVIGGMLRAASAPFREAAARLGQAIAGAFRGVWDGIKSLFRRGLSATVGVMKFWTTPHRAAARAIGRAVVSGFDAIKGLSGVMRRALSGVVDGIRGFIGRFANAGLSLAKALIRGFGDVGKGILRALKNGLSGATLIPSFKVKGPGPLPDISFPAVKLPSFAKGGRLKEALALVGEEGFELAKLPGGKLTLLGQEGPEIRELPIGTQVFSHPQTKRKLPDLAQKVIQRLVPAVSRVPEPLTQQVIQEALGTEPGKGSQGVALSKPLEAFSAAQIVRDVPSFRLGGVVSRDEERKRRRGQPQETAETSKKRDRDLEATKSVRSTGKGRAIKDRANRLDRARLPYVWGGNHGLPYNLREGFDCSSAVSYVLGIAPRVSGNLAGYGAPGKGAVSIFANAKHTFMSIFGRGFGTSKENPGGGPGWISYNSRSGFTVSHLADVAPPGEGEAEEEGPKYRHHGRYNLGQMVTLAKRAGFPDPALAAAVGYAESRGDTAARNKTSREDSRGLWQVNLKAHPKWRKRDLSDAFVNVRAAYEISRGGKDWTPWTQYTNGAYKEFLNNRAQPLPRGTQRGTPTGSRYADFLDMKLTEAEGTPSDPRDDIRWINRGLRYYRGVYRRNKRSGNFSRANEALQQVQTLNAKKRELRAKTEDEELFVLGESFGTGPNRFRLQGMQRVIDGIELEKARAALTIPANNDDSPGSLAASLQDDIAAAGKLVSVWESLNALASGGSIYNPYTKKVDTVKPLGTIRQQIDAATNLAQARSELKNLQSEAGGVGAPADIPEARESQRPQQVENFRLFSEALKELLKAHGANITVPTFGHGGTVDGPIGKPRIIQAHSGEEVLSVKQLKLLKEILEKAGVKGENGGRVVNQTINFQTQPRDFHTFARSALVEEQAV